MTYEAVKYLASYIGIFSGLISAGTLMGIIWNSVSGMFSNDAELTKKRIKNLVVAFVISLVLAGGLLTWAAGYIDGAGSWMTKIVGWSK